jgi:hypothetical protein
MVLTSPVAVDAASLSAVPWAPSRLRSSRAIELALLVLYAAITLVVVLHHEPWRDEADAWLFARDGDLRTIATWTGYAGTPALWYLLLVPLARSGLPYLSESLLHVGIGVAAVTVFLWHAPFSRLTKCLFVFSYYMAYEYAVVARSYGLSVLLLFCVAALYRVRLARPLTYALPICLLFNTNAHSLATAACLTAGYTWDAWRAGRLTPRHLLATGIMAAGGGLALLQLRTPSDGNIVGVFRMFAPENAAISINLAFLPLSGTLALLPLPVFTLAVAFVWLRKTPLPLLVLSGSYAWLCYIFVFKYAPSPRHAAFVLIILLFALWISAADRKEGLHDVPASGRPGGLRHQPLRLALASLNGCLGISVLAAVLFWSLDVRFAFSGAAEMADFIRANHLGSHVIAAHRAAYAEALLPYLEGERFWYAGVEDFGTYMRWDSQFRQGDELPLEEAARRVQERFSGEDGVLFLANQQLRDAGERGFQLLHKTTGRVFGRPDETYFLYRRADV